MLLFLYSNYLGGIGLGRGDPDLRSCVDVDSTVSLARDGRADRVGDAHGQRATRLAVAKRVQRVRGLARLGDEEANVISVVVEKKTKQYLEC